MGGEAFRKVIFENEIVEVSLSETNSAVGLVVASRFNLIPGTDFDHPNGPVSSSQCPQNVAAVIEDPLINIPLSSHTLKFVSGVNRNFID